MINYKRIKKDCFWEYNFSDDEILEFSTSDNARVKSFLFQKILLNSTNLFSDLKIFDKKTLQELSPYTKLMS